MVPLLEAEFVTGRKWIGEEEFLDIISIAESTPGPIAINMATYIGYKMAGIGGAAVSTVAVCIPSFVIIYLISLLFQQFMEFSYVQYAFRGIQACVVYLIFSAGVRMLRALEKSGFEKAVLLLVAISMFACAMLSIRFSSVLCILLCGMAGIVCSALSGCFRKGGEEK